MLLQGWHPIRDILARMNLLNVQQNRCLFCGDVEEENCHLFIHYRTIRSTGTSWLHYGILLLCAHVLLMSSSSISSTWTFSWEIFWHDVLFSMLLCDQFEMFETLLSSTKKISINMLASNFSSITSCGGWRKRWGMLLQLLSISVISCYFVFI